MNLSVIPRAFACALAILAAPGAAVAAEGHADRVGIVYRGELDDLRLAIAHEALPLGSRIAIVMAPEGVVLCCATAGAAYILQPGEFDPVYLDDEGKTTYALDAAGISADVSLGFGVVDPPPDLAATNAMPDLNGDGRAEGFRSCASGEGLHLTVWYGEPLTTSRLWHGYFYLGYDTEADCDAKDLD